MGVADIEDEDFLSRLSDFNRFSGAECGGLEDGGDWSRPRGVGGVGEEPRRGGGGRGGPVDPGTAIPATAAAAAATLFLVPPLNIALNE